MTQLFPPADTHGADSADTVDYDTPPTESYRTELSHGEDAIDRRTWAGGIAPRPAIAPRLRIGRPEKDRWLNLLWLIPIGLVVVIATVALAQWLRGTGAVQSFIADFPGTRPNDPASGAIGTPWWMGVQHFVNILFMMFIIRSGWQILTDHPRLYWTRHSAPGKEWVRIAPKAPDDPLWTAKQDSVELPQQVGLPGIRHSIGIARWWHFVMDLGWLANGAIFYVLLFTTGQWRKIVPTSWDVFPNALSTMIQYASLNFPDDNGWLAYNDLQLLAYFITVFIAGPAAMITGLGMSPAISTRLHKISKHISIQLARSLHALVMVWFVVFIIMHVTMVFTTDALKNLNAMFAARHADDAVGLGFFAIAMTIVIVAWVWASPFTIKHPRTVQRVGETIVGPLQRRLEKVNLTPGTYTESDISEYFWHNGTYPESDEYRELMAGNFVDYRLRINGLVDNPTELSLADLHALPHHEQITQHYCIQGWSGIAKWGGVSMSTILDLVQPAPEAKWVVFYSIADGSDGGIYYDAHPIEQMRGALAMLAYEMNGEPLSYGHGAPLRLRNEMQLGFKMVKWIKGIEFVAHYSEVGSGFGGYNEDHEYFGRSQSI